MWLWAITLTLDFEGHILKNLYHSNKRVDWHGTKRMWVDRMLGSSYDFKPWPHPWPSPWIFKVKFLIAYFRNGKVDRLGIKEFWVGYNVVCTMGLLLGHSALQIDRPSNGSMWNSVSNLLAHKRAIRSLIEGLRGVVVLWTPCYMRQKELGGFNGAKLLYSVW